MAVIFIDGFDKYQGNFNNVFGEWTTGAGSNSSSFVAGAYQGQAFKCGQDNGLQKTLSANYPTLIWGMRILCPVLSSFAVTLNDSTTNQFTIRVNSNGQFEARRGSEGGGVIGIQGSALLGTSSATIAINTWHYLECKATINGAAGAFNLYLDGVQILAASGLNTSVTGNPYANSFLFKSTDFNNNVLVDDLYLFDNTGPTNNDVIGDSVVETQYPISDASVQWTIGASAIGFPFSSATNVDEPNANILFLRKVTTLEDCILNSISIIPESSAPSAKYQMVLYSDSGGPHALLSGGVEVIGTSIGVILTGNLISPQALTANTSYWIGFINDTGNISLAKTTNTSFFGLRAGNSYAGGPPAFAPFMISASDFVIWGTVTSNVNFAEVQSSVSSPLVNYVTNTAVGDEDQYNFAALSTVPQSVYVVKVSAFAAKSDAGSRTMSLMVKSGVTDDPGNNPDIPMTASYVYQSSYWSADPATGLPWTYSTVNNATSGMKITG